MQCVKMGDDGFIQFYRYPGKGGDTMSRDHVGAILLALYINRDTDELQWILNNLPWVISRKYNQTIDFWIWTKCLRNSKWKFYISQIFYILVLLQFVFILPWNNLVRLILGVKKYDNIKLPIFKKMFGWKKKLSKSIYPQYALFLLAWQIKVCSNSWLKKATQWIVKLESGNIVIDAVLGSKINRIDWLRFKPASSFIWAGRLDSLTEIDIHFLNKDESKYNDLNKGMLDYLYFKIDKIMLEYQDEVIQAIKNKEPIIQY